MERRRLERTREGRRGKGVGRSQATSEKYDTTLYHAIPRFGQISSHLLEEWADLWPPLWGQLKPVKRRTLLVISAEGESNEIGRWVHGGAGFWGWVGGLLSNIETSQIRACGHKSLQLRIRPGKTGRWD